MKNEEQRDQAEERRGELGGENMKKMDSEGNKKKTLPRTKPIKQRAGEVRQGH